jgi:FkbM family methyltransferase
MRVAPDLGDGRIYAVEASPTCHALLDRNVRYNGFKNVIPPHRGVWNEISTLELEPGYAQANSLVSEVHTGERTVTVLTITIDGLVESQSIQRVDMISLTLNGAEAEALQGAEKTLADHQPRILLAGWYERDGKLIAEICREILEPQGGRVFVGPRDNTLATAT